MERELIRWLVRYGAPVLFVAQVFGIFGLPIPDELLMTVAGALVARRMLSAGSTVTAAVAGCLTGITLSYALGRSVGLAIVRSRLHRRQHVLERAQRWFRRFGGWFLAFGYFVPGVRHVTAITAGSGLLDYPTFARFAYPGGVVWCGVFLGLGYYAGDRWREVAHAARAHLAVGAGLAAGAVVVYGLLRFTADRRLRS